MTVCFPEPVTLEKLTETLAEIRETGEPGADVSFARLFARHGRGTVEARRHAREYFENRSPAA